MQYGHFDHINREYVIDRVDLPVSWTNYLGVEKMCAVVNHTAGGYLFYESPEYHRVTRFRGNGVPMDRPGHYVYLRDDDTGEFWSVSWQPCGGELADYRCRHGLSYSIYESKKSGIDAAQTLFIPRGEAVELWDVKLKNQSGRPRRLSVFSYAEFSFHHILMDNQNFQMSLYASGSSYADGIIDYELFYEGAHQFFTANVQPDGFDCLRDVFLGTYGSETEPAAVRLGACSGSFEKGGNHCAALHKRLTLEPGEETRLLFLLGEGGMEEGARLREKYAKPAPVDAALEDLRRFWAEKLEKLQVRTPNADMDTMLNTWNLYQSEVNVMFSRFASFIEVGGRTGLGYRDTAQDAMTIPHSNPEGCKKRILQLMQGLTSQGYGLHLFDPRWFEPQTAPEFKSPTVVPTPDKSEMIHGLKDACSDDALWLVASVAEYIRETGDEALCEKTLGYDQPFKVLFCDRVPEEKHSPTAVGRHLEGCRIGFDAGGSDRKVSAVIDGVPVFSEEVVWFPKTSADPDYHFAGIVEALKSAAAHLPRVDAIGISSAGIYIENQTRKASLFLQVPPALFAEKVRDIYLRAAQEIGAVPVAVCNDGDVTALAGAMSLGENNVLGIAMGTSEAVGFVDADGNITGWLNELAFMPVDASPNAMKDEWSGDIGCGVKYFSQDAVIKLAPAAGIHLDADLSPAEKLKAVQTLMETEGSPAEAIYRSIGVYLGHSLALYHHFYGFRHVLLLGRVMSGRGGDLILDACKAVLRDEYPELSGQIFPTLPDEKARRVGQSVAAASLPALRT